MARFWRWMARVYGHRWTSQYGDAPDGAWARGLADIDGEQVAHGMRLMLERYPSWPPTLGELRALCVGERGIPGPHRMPPSRVLPEPEDVRAARYARGRAQLAAIRERMGWAAAGILGEEG